MTPAAIGVLTENLSGPTASSRLVHQHHWITPEEVGETQPVSDPASGCSITCDARLDNRSELIRTLGRSGDDTRSSDAWLILESYLRWGTDCLAHLHGAFVFAIWDPALQHLLIGRDAMGERSAMYFVTDRLFLLASEVGPLLAHPAVPCAVNENAVGALIEGLWAYSGESYFQGIFYCAPAHGMLVSRDRIRQWRYWEADPAARLRYHRHGDYVEHFLELFVESVRCRMRTRGAVGVSMSGGLDSLGVGTVAANLLAGVTDGQRHLLSYSYTFHELPSCDERVYFEPVVARWKMDATHVPGDDAWALRDLSRWPVYRDIPAQDPGVWLTTGVLKAARAHDCRVLFTGLGGDELFEGAMFWAAEQIRELRWAATAHEMLRHGADFDWRHSVWYNGVRQAMPSSLRRAYRALRRRPAVLSHPGVHPLLAEHARLADRGEAERSSPRWASATTWRRYQGLVDYTSAEGLALLRQLGLAYGVEYAHPFYDRRLAEFALSIPADMLGVPHRTKRLLRDAMQCYAPDTAWERHGKTSLVPLLERGLLDRERDAVASLMARPQIVEREYIRREWLDEQLGARHRWASDGYLLWVCICLEIWLNHNWPQQATAGEHASPAATTIFQR